MLRLGRLENRGQPPIPKLNKRIARDKTRFRTEVSTTPFIEQSENLLQCDDQNWRAGEASRRLDPLGVNRPAVFVQFHGSNVGLTNGDPELRLGGVDHVAKRQISGIDGAGSIKVPQDYFNLTNCNLSHTFLTHNRDRSFP